MCSSKELYSKYIITLENPIAIFPSYSHLVQNYYERTKKHLKNEQRSSDAVAKKELIEVEQGKLIIIMRISIYIPPYNNTH